MLMALLKVMLCVACKVTVLLALEIVSAPMVVSDGSSENWSKSSNWPW